MGYNPNIPLATDLMLKSQGQCRANFQSINSVIAQNHVKLNLDFQGMHPVLSLRKQVGDPTTTVDQLSLYTKDVGSVPQLFFRPNNNQTAIQMTFPSITTGIQSIGPPIVYFPTQQTFMAGPFVVHAGLYTSVANGAVKTLSPATTLIYVGLQMRNQSSSPTFSANTAVAATNIAGNQFTIKFDTSINTPDIYYLAIGL